MFLGNTASLLTTSQLTTGVTGVADLPGGASQRGDAAPPPCRGPALRTALVGARSAFQPASASPTCLQPLRPAAYNPALQAGKRVAVPGGIYSSETTSKLRKRGVPVTLKLPFETPLERQQALGVLRSGKVE